MVATRCSRCPPPPVTGCWRRRTAAPCAAIVTSSDLEAGYAADGYARLKGLGAVSVSYGPGVLSMINAIAGAWVERSPVVIINGGPSAGDLSNQSDLGILFSHSAGTADLDRSLFRDITAAHERASTAAAVPHGGRPCHRRRAAAEAAGVH